MAPNTRGPLPDIVRGPGRIVGGSALGIVHGPRGLVRGGGNRNLVRGPSKIFSAGNVAEGGLDNVLKFRELEGDEHWTLRREALELVLNPPGKRPPLPEPEDCFTVDLHRKVGESLGIQLSKELVIQSILVDGTFDKWNTAADAGTIVQVGDRVVEVNGKRDSDDVFKLLEMAKEHPKLIITFFRKGFRATKRPSFAPAAATPTPEPPERTSLRKSLPKPEPTPEPAHPQPKPAERPPPPPKVSGPPEVDVEGGRPLEHIGHGYFSHGKAYQWIRSDNSWEAREARRVVGQLTRQAAEAGGYRKGGRYVALQYTNESLNGTKRLAPSLGNLAPPKGRPTNEMTEVFKSKALALQTARDLLPRHRDRIAVVTAASGYHCGGGFITGGRHALEEAICTQTTLYPSISKADSEVRMEFGEAAEGQFVAYIPYDGVVLSPKVEVFRDGSDLGYPFLDKAQVLDAVISVAMFNKNPKMSDCPVDAPGDNGDYEEAVSQKFRSLLSCAVQARCSALVMPDVGCGVYENDPDVVGRLFGRVLRSEFWGHLREVALVGKPEFQNAALKEIEVCQAAVKRENENPALALAALPLEDERHRRPAGGGVGPLPGGLPQPPPMPGDATSSRLSGPGRASGREGAPPPPIAPDQQPRTSSSSPPPPPRQCTPCGDVLCKFGCGRPVKEGLLPSGRPYDTCCRTCARGKGHGGHDSDCNPGAAGVAAVVAPAAPGGSKVCACGATLSATARFCGTCGRPQAEQAGWSAPPPPAAARIMCKFGCGRRAKEGTLKSGRPFDTCCRACAVSHGSGNHDPTCVP